MDWKKWSQGVQQVLNISVWMLCCFKQGFSIRSQQPWPYRSLMIGLISLQRWAFTASFVVGMHGRQCAQSVRRKQIVMDALCYRVHFFLKKRRVWQRNCKNLIGAYGTVLLSIIPYICQPAFIIFCLYPQSFSESFLQLLQQGRTFPFRFMVFFCQAVGKRKRIVPQGIYFNRTG